MKKTKEITHEEFTEVIDLLESVSNLLEIRTAVLYDEDMDLIGFFLGCEEVMKELPDDLNPYIVEPEEDSYDA